MQNSRSPLKSNALDALIKRGVPVATVLDVGIHRGTPELVAAYPSARHELFEPIVEFREAIRTNYAGVNYALHEVAVGDSDGEVRMKVRRIMSGMDISHSAMVDADAPDTEELRTVPKVTLDRFTAGHGLSGPFLLKVDIDGHEMQVLRGAERTLQACSIVIVECAGSSLPERIGFMQDRGFRLFDLCEPCYYDDCFWQADAVFLSRQAFADHFKNLYDTFDERLYARFA